MKACFASLRFALNFLASGLVLCAAASATHAQTVIDTLPYTITKGGLYVLNSNLTSTLTKGNLITLNASNVTIDFQNHYISGPVSNVGLPIFGIYSKERSNISIKNGTVAYCAFGILLTGDGTATTNSVNHRIDNMRVTYCYNVGLYLDHSPASRLTNCQVSHIGYNEQGDTFGIIADGPGHTIQNNVISTILGTNPLGVSASAGSFVRQNTISNAKTGVNGGTYQDNLTANCMTPFSSGTDAGGNN